MKSRRSWVSQALSFALLALVGCGSPTDADSTSTANDATDGELKEKKGLVGGVPEGSPTALGILQIVNEFSLSNLQDLVGLSFDSAYAIDLYKDPNTWDDDHTVTRFTSLAQIVALPDFASAEFPKLRQYAVDHGLTGDTTRPSCGGTTCVYHPTTRARLFDVHGTSDDDVWTVGENGTVLHWNGTWSTVPAFTAEDLTRVFAIAKDDVYASTRESLYHHDGSTWRKVTLPGITSITSIWASGPRDVFVGGKHPPSPSVTSIVHFDGSSWTETADFSERASAQVIVVHGGVNNITGDDAKHVYMDTSDSYVYAFDYAKNRWTSAFDLNDGSFGSGLHAVGNRVYAVSQYRVLEVDASSRQKTRSFDDRAIGADAITAISGPSPSSLYVASMFSPLLRFDGVSWQPVYSSAVNSAPLYGVWAPKTGGAWAVGTQGTILHTTR